MQKTRARLADCIPMGEDDSLITQEAAVAVRVTHPHIVTTYKYAIKYSEKQPGPSRASVDRAGGSRASEDSHQPRMSVDQQGRIAFDRRSSLADSRPVGDTRAAGDKARAAGLPPVAWQSAGSSWSSATRAPCRLVLPEVSVSLGLIALASRCAVLSCACKSGFQVSL